MCDPPSKMTRHAGKAIGKKRDSLRNPDSEECGSLTDWVSVIDKDYDRITTVQSRRSKVIVAAIATMISIATLGWGIITQHDFTWQNAVDFAPWWVAVNLLFMAVSVLESVYLRVYLPGLAESIAKEQKYPMLTPVSLVTSLTYFLMAIGSGAAIWSGQPGSGAILYGFVAASMSLSGLFILFNLNVRSVFRWALHWSPRIQARVRDSTTQPRPFTSTMVGAFFFYAFLGLILVGLIWKSDTWSVAVQSSFLLSAFIVAVKRYFQESGRTTLADKIVFQLLELRVEILSDKDLTEDAIASRYRLIFHPS